MVQINDQVKSVVTVNGQDHEYTAYAVIHDLDSTPKRYQKRTSGYSRKVHHMPAVFRLSSTHPIWSAFNQDVLMEYNFSEPSWLAPVLANIVIDYDTALDRVLPEVIERFNFLMAAYEMVELKSLANGFYVRAMSFLTKVMQGVTNIALLNNLVVVPTMQSIVDFFKTKEDTYDMALKAYEALRRPTKFSAQPIKDTVRETETLTLLTISSFDYSISCVVDVHTKTHYKVRGTGVIQAISDPNLLLLSSYTSGFHIDPSLIWNVLPFSFLIDYFANIGDILATDRSDICEFSLSGCSEQTLVEITQRTASPRLIVEGTPPFPIDSISFEFVSAGYCKIKRFSRFAYPYDSQPAIDGLDPVYRYNQGDLSVSQWVNTISIIWNIALGLAGGLINRRL